MAAKFLDTLNTAVTINFTKQLKKEDIVKTLANNLTQPSLLSGTKKSTSLTSKRSILILLF